MAISPCCWQCTEPSLHPPLASTGEGRVGRCWAGQRNKDTWFLLLSFKEHLFLGKVLGPRVAGGAAGSARRRHGRFCCAFLKERKKRRNQPALPPSRGHLCLRGQRPGKDDIVQPVMIGFSLLPTKPNQTGRGTEGCRAVPSPHHPKPLTRGEPMGEKKTKPEQSQLLPPALPPSWLCKRVGAEPTCPAPRGLCSDPEALTLGRNSYRRPR